MENLKFSEGLSGQITHKFGQFKFKKSEDEHAYRVFVSQSLIPFMKILNFALLLLCIPELCFLSFQQRVLKQSKVCI